MTGRKSSRPGRHELARAVFNTRHMVRLRHVDGSMFE